MQEDTKSIKFLEKEILKTFELFDGDSQLCLSYVMDLGARLPKFPHKLKLSKYRVHSCMALTWIRPSYKDGLIHLQGASESLTTQGLIAIVIMLFSGQKPSKVLEFDNKFFPKLGLEKLIGIKRRSGLQAILDEIIAFASKCNY